LKLTRIIIETAKKELETNNEKQKQLFYMIIVFTEKIQESLYKLSTELLSSQIQINNSNSNVV